MPETNLAGAAVVAERLRLAVADEPFVLQDSRYRLPVTVSIGLAVTAPGEGLDALLKRADDALYAAKNGGRNRVVAAPPALSRMPVAIAS
jgi:two-component system cell cycle response regulator